MLSDHFVGKMFGGTTIDQFLDCTEFHTLEMDADVLRGDITMDKMEEVISPVMSDSAASEDEGGSKKKKNKIDREVRLLMPDHRPTKKPWKSDDEGKNYLYERIFQVWQQISNHVWFFSKLTI